MASLQTIRSPARLRNYFLITLAVTAAYFFWLKSFLLPFTNEEIFRFEIAKTTDRATAIIQEWKNAGIFESGVTSVYFDFGFILLYCVLIYLGCRYLSRITGNEILMKGGNGFSLLILVAGMADVVENIAMLQSLQRAVSQWSVLLAYNMARIKFSLIIVCLLFMLACFLYWLILKIAGKET
jgi:hypothetical protein